MKNRFLKRLDLFTLAFIQCCLYDRQRMITHL